MKSIKNESYSVDSIIIGAGIFGLYAAKILSEKGKKVVILEKCNKPFKRASAINQARVHNGYHYPRSYETAKKVAEYFEKFNKEFGFAIHNSFEHVYAISNHNSKTSAEEFKHFCNAVNIPLASIDNNNYFNEGSVETSFLVEEPVFDFGKIRDYLLDRIGNKAKYVYGAIIEGVEEDDSNHIVFLQDGSSYASPLVINATYVGVNEVLHMFKKELFDIKYELCEVAYCKVPHEYKNVGFTVMDGDYFSTLPFGFKDMHTFTSVGHTPHEVCYENMPIFSKKILQNEICKMHEEKGCIACSQKPQTAWCKMHNLCNEYLKPKFAPEYQYSEFEIKPILKESENDDSRPTIINNYR
ncbi:FAD-dependent oxidoreductase [Patescibacteria group bacterium]|nr:FAD-dependent oxidoreductase [Patescibacteria group bacterium]